MIEVNVQRIVVCKDNRALLVIPDRLRLTKSGRIGKKEEENGFDYFG
jgi:hypothetical protein